MILAYVFSHVKDWFVWFGRLPQIVQILSALATGAALILAFRNWIFALWDRKVLRYMEYKRSEVDIMRGHNLVLGAIPLYEIGRAVKRGPRSVTRSLVRLKRNGKVHQVRRRKWLPGERPSVGKTTGVSRWAPRWE
jgi:hypothetical protein